MSVIYNALRKVQESDRGSADFTKTGGISAPEAVSGPSRLKRFSIVIAGAGIVAVVALFIGLQLAISPEQTAELDNPKIIEKQALRGSDVAVVSITKTAVGFAEDSDMAAPLDVEEFDQLAINDTQTDSVAEDQRLALEEIAIRRAVLEQQQIEARNEAIAQRQIAVENQRLALEQIEMRRALLAGEQIALENDRLALQQVTSKRDALAQRQTAADDKLFARDKATSRREALALEQIAVERDALAMEQISARRDLLAREQIVAKRESLLREQMAARREALAREQVAADNERLAREQATARKEILASLSTGIGDIKPGLKRKNQKFKRLKINKISQRLYRAISMNDEAAVAAGFRELHNFTSPDSTFSLKMQAIWSIKKGDDKQGRLLFNEVLKRNPSDVDAGVNIAVMDIRANDVARARHRLEELAITNPQNRTVLSLLEQLGR